MTQNEKQDRTTRVLIVEDNLNQLRMLTDLVKLEGFAAVDCKSGTEALAFVDKEKVGIVIMDLRLPDIDGMQLLNQLRKRHSALRVIIHTAYGSFSSAKDAVNLGAFAYVEKAGDPAELIRHLHEANISYLQLYTKELEAAVAEGTAALQQSETRYRSLFENAVEGLFFSTLKGRFTRVNPALVRMLGYASEEEVLSLNLPVDLYIDSRQREQLQEQHHPGGIANGVELMWKKKNGDPIIVSLYGKAVHDSQGYVVAYEGMVLDITDSKHAEEMLQTLSRQLLMAQEQERRRIAHELHGEIGQSLTAVKINLETARRSPETFGARIEESIQLVANALQQARTLSLDLRPPMLDDLGLVAALRWHVDQQAQRVGYVGHFVADTLDFRLPQELETACFRVAQEALTNVARHAQARNVWVELRYGAATVHLLVRDDGVAFDVVAAQKRSTRGKSLGLLGMQERAQLVGGRVRVYSFANQGTEVHAWFPFSEDNWQEVGGNGQTAEKAIDSRQ
ncbi:MAG: response regulator [Candidatus Binatia bacterium]